MKKLNYGTQKYSRALWAWNNCDYGDIRTAYVEPSDYKCKAYSDIWFRATQTEGYNHDLRVVARSSSYFSTMYSYTDEQGTHVVYDTYANIYTFDI